PTIAQYVFGVIATILFVFLFSMIGYTVGAIVQYNKIFIFLLPILIIAYFIMSAQTGQSNLLIVLFEFYFVESSFLLYLLKVVGTCGFLFSVVTILTNR